jgi:hypothetical protein
MKDFYICKTELDLCVCFFAKIDRIAQNDEDNCTSFCLLCNRFSSVVSMRVLYIQVDSSFVFMNLQEQSLLAVASSVVRYLLLLLFYYLFIWTPSKNSLSISIFGYTSTQLARPHPFLNTTLACPTGSWGTLEEASMCCDRFINYFAVRWNSKSNRFVTRVLAYSVEITRVVFGVARCSKCPAVLEYRGRAGFVLCLFCSEIVVCRVFTTTHRAM